MDANPCVGIVAPHLLSHLILHHLLNLLAEHDPLEFDFVTAQFHLPVPDDAVRCRPSLKEFLQVRFCLFPVGLHVKDAEKGMAVPIQFKFLLDSQMLLKTAIIVIEEADYHFVPVLRCEILRRIRFLQKK